MDGPPSASGPPDPGRKGRLPDLAAFALLAYAITPATERHIYLINVALLCVVAVASLGLLALTHPRPTSSLPAVPPHGGDM